MLNIDRFCVEYLTSPHFLYSNLLTKHQNCKWADSMGHDHREPLWNQLARPFKRLMQYTLMLQNIRKYCTEQDELASVDRMHSNISAFVRTIDHQITNPDPQEKMLEKLVEKLQFPEYNENPGDGYQYFYDHYKRVSLLEDIELPAPILLTVPELKFLASSSMRDRGYSDVNEPNDFGDITILSPMQTVDSPLQRVFPTRSSRRFVSRQYKDMAASCLNLVENVAPAAGMENGTETSGVATQCEYLHVKLFRCASRKTHESDRIYPSALERIRSTETSSSWRRTVPRGICYQGALRFREGQGKWSNVKCFLLTDQLLITKANSKGYRVCRPPIRLDKLAFHRLDDNGHFACASLDDFHMIIALYTFMTTAAQSINWCSQLEYAQTAYQQLMRPEMLVAEPVLPKTSSTVSTGLDTGGIGASTNLNRLHRVNSTANLSSTPTETTQKMDPKRPTLLALCRNQQYNQSKNQVGPSSSNIQDHSPAQRSRLFGSTERGLVISDNRARSIIDMPYGRPESPSVSSRRVRNHQHFGVSIPVTGRTAKSHSLGSACKSHREETSLDHRSSFTLSDEINAHIRRTGKLDADLSPANETKLTASCSTDSGESGMLHASPVTPDQSDLHTGIGQDFNYSLQRNSESNSLNATSSSIRSVSTSQPCQSSSDVDEYGESDVDLDWSSSLTPTNRASIRALRVHTLPPSRANLC